MLDLTEADAVFIEGLDEVVVNTTSKTQGSVKDVKKVSSYNEQNRTQENKRKLLSAKLLKYKKWKSAKAENKYR